MKKTYFYGTVLFLMIVTGLFVLVSCGGGGGSGNVDSPDVPAGEEGAGPPPAGGLQVASIEVLANPSNIPADGASTSTITATARTSTNQAVPDAEVTFETSSGTITAAADTDNNGRAQATLTSERVNNSNVTVTARCQGVSGTASVAFTGVTLSLNADPDNLLADGTTTSEITATLEDAAGSPIPDATVDFSTNRGMFLNGTSSTSAITNPSGQASALLMSAESGTATVSAKGRNATSETQVVFTRWQFSLTASPGSIRADGTESSTLTATLLKADGTGEAGRTVSFSTTIGGLTQYTVTTNASGVATTTLQGTGIAGKATVCAEVTASDGTQLSSSTHLSLVGGDAAKIVLTADPDVIPTNTGTATITATVYDASDNPAPNQDIYFRILSGPRGGENLDRCVEKTNQVGVATVTLSAGMLPSRYHHDVEIEANTEADFSGSSGTTSLTIAGPVANIGIGIDLHTLTPEEGHLKVDVSALATDVNGNPVPDGTTVYFSVKAVGFDEDRDNDGIINCADADGNPLTPCPAPGTPGFGETWFSDDVNQDGIMYSQGGPMSETEDENENGILDPGEDKNGNGVMDPVNSCSIPREIGTSGGVAVSTLTYLQAHAANIKVRITAEAGGISNFYETKLLCTETMVSQGTCGIGY